MMLLPIRKSNRKSGYILQQRLPCSNRQPLKPLYLPQANCSSHILEAQQLLLLPVRLRRLKANRQACHAPLQRLFRPVSIFLENTIHDKKSFFFEFVFHTGGEFALMLALGAGLPEDVADEGFEFGQGANGMFAVLCRDAEKRFFVPDLGILLAKIVTQEN